MLRRYISLIKSVTSSISNVRHCIASMSSQGLVLTGTSDEELECCKRTQNGAGLCSCNEVSIKRTISSHTKASEESQDHKAREELQWNKLSENEKNIYFAHKTACLKGENTYTDPVTGYMVFTEEFLRKRRACCGNGCRHCPYGQENAPEQSKKKFNSAFYV
ncbi:uncharacterized protein [Porites lutea]|uniref:uncharacterized protein n=1 Tax=Porites lutea TaxID=51062 RepID=UPI003CC58746